MDDDFVPDAQDDFEPDPPELQNKTLPHENILQRAIKNSRIGPFGGTSITAAVPSSGAEGMDFLKVLGRQIPGMRGGAINPMTQGPVAIGLNQMGFNKADDAIPGPESQYGKNLESSADIGQLAVLGGELGTAGAKGIHKFFSTAAPQKELASLTGQIGEVTNKGLDLAYEAPKDIKAKIGEMFDKARNAYKSILENHPADIPKAALKDVVSKTIKGLGLEGRSFLDPAERALVHADETFHTTPTMTGEQVDTLKDFRDVKNFKSAIFNALDSNKGAQGEFLKNYGDMLIEQGFGDVADVNAQYSKAYQNARDAKVFTEGRLGRIAGGGKIAPKRVSSMLDLEEQLGLGTEHTKRAQGIADETAHLKGKAAEKENEIEKLIGRQKFAKGLAGKFIKGLPYGAGLGTGYGIYQLLGGHHE